MALDVYGLRLLAKPRVQRLALGTVLGVVLLYRLLQIAALTGEIQWGFDFSFYWAAASHLLHGEPIYSAAQLAGTYRPQGQEGFLYPPPFAAVLVPVAALLPVGAREINWLWFVVGGLIVVSTVLAVGSGSDLERRFTWLRGRGRWWLVGAAFAFPPVIAELVLGNVHLEILGLLGLAWLGIRRGFRRGELVAGAAIGAATLIKIFPGLVIVWLLATRRWRGALAAFASIVVLSVVTLPISGIEPWQQYPVVLAHLGLSDATDTLAPTIWLAPYLGYDLARAVVMLAGAALVLAVAMRTSRANLAASFGVAVTASVLIAPAVYQHYLAILVLPILLGLSAGVPVRWLGLAYLLMWGGKQPALGDLAWVFARGVPTVGALLLLVVLTRIAWSPRSRASGDDVPLRDRRAEHDLGHGERPEEDPAPAG